MNSFDPINIPLPGRHLIEASAGTGKTYSITSLYIRLLLGHGSASSRFERALQVNEILVVTFTNAATAELRGRIRNRIVKAIAILNRTSADREDEFLYQLHQELHRKTDQAGDPHALKRALRILTAASLMMDTAAIYSIHGFCARMLAEFAFQSKLPFELSMDSDDHARVTTAIKDTWLELVYGDDKSIADTTMARWENPSSMADAVAMLARKREVILCSDSTAQSWHEAAIAVGKFKHCWRDAEAAIKQAIIDANLLARFNNNLDEWLADMHAFAMNESLQPPKCFQQFTKQGFTREQHAGARSSVPDHPIFIECEQLLTTFIHIRSNLDRKVIGKVQSRMQRETQRTHTLTPDDLLTYLDEALRGPGEELAANIRNKHPIALVDEFQDTDPTQYRIFDTIYAREKSCGLFMIGDPKQAVYKFRGADIYTYINAKRGVDRQARYNLGTNFRSTAELIAAINTLFERPNAFLNDEDIPYIPVIAPQPPATAEVFTIEGTQPAAMTCWHYISTGEKALSYTETRSAMAEIAANEVHRLLTSNTLIGEKPLLEKEIAILVRSKTDARPIIDALKARNIGSTYRQRANVFRSEAAKNLWLTLKAAIEPANDRLIRAAYACPLMNRSLQQLCQLETDTDLYLNLVLQFQRYHDIWQAQGILPMLQAWMIDQDIMESTRSRADGERLLTDLRQLGELLQMQSSRVSGMHELMQYLHREMQKEDEREVIEDNMLRLESDENLVQIVTIHSSKGLQFDVVMIPMAASAREDNTPIYHEIPVGRSDYVTYCDLAATGLSIFPNADKLTSKEKHVLDQVNDERLAEELRLFYVAVTRAKKKCYIGLANLAFNSANMMQANLAFADSAPGHLLLGGSGTDDSNISQALANLAGNDQIEVVEIIEPETADAMIATAEKQTLRRPKNAPSIIDDWQLSSYSALTRNLHKLQQHSGTGDDADVSTIEVVKSAVFSRFSFPKGAHTGVMLHTLFEQLDFTATDTAIREKVSSHLIVNGFDAEKDNVWFDVFTAWTIDVLQSNLSADSNAPLRLCSIDNSQKLVEMEFYFPLHQPVSAASINQLLQAYGYMTDEQPALGFSNIQGMMKGFIDLTFMHDGKCYLLDYKSNHLGDTVADYAADRLPSAISANRYDLQYLIYTVALHRYLKSKMAGYDYASHFGGAYYLYLRGMAGDESLNGVYFDLPDGRLIEALDQLFGAELASQVAA